MFQWWSKDEGVESSDSHQPASSKSIQTEQCSAREIDVLKKLNQQLMNEREKEKEETKQCIQLLQQELDKRFNEAVVNAARLREVESQLAESQPSQTSETPTPLQVADEPVYKSMQSHFV